MHFHFLSNSAIAQLDLLQKLYARIIIPTTVYNEESSWLRSIFVRHFVARHNIIRDMWWLRRKRAIARLEIFQQKR
ncbi:hypothetical protein IQ249_10875 [Lusitaniella coriacea LEGE 07157]|uniref:Uncharacterized protein n=1 Tax=Lusitaniella coriacea LEGE 07157 TaxID=945747 RepID=A0A8J7ISU0_9CYAN|nr:hypothetical protein [Lusitaniella coriacea]MBE9116402.1 hypothetical protein [Lusitaniella coriacea LEGE 07157]